jgi:hypothetical protein
MRAAATGEHESPHGNDPSPVAQAGRRRSNVTNERKSSCVGHEVSNVGHRPAWLHATCCGSVTVSARYWAKNFLRSLLRNCDIMHGN